MATPVDSRPCRVFTHLVDFEETPDSFQSIGQFLSRPISMAFGEGYEIDSTKNKIGHIPSLTERILAIAFTIIFSPICLFTIPIGLAMVWQSDSHLQCYEKVFSKAVGAPEAKVENLPAAIPAALPVARDASREKTRNAVMLPPVATAVPTVSVVNPLSQEVPFSLCMILNSYPKGRLLIQADHYYCDFKVRGTEAFYEAAIKADPDKAADYRDHQAKHKDETFRFRFQVRTKSPIETLQKALPIRDALRKIDGVKLLNEEPAVDATKLNSLLSDALLYGASSGETPDVAGCRFLLERGASATDLGRLRDQIVLNYPLIVATTSMVPPTKELFELFLTRGAQLAITDEWGNSLLHLAMAENRYHLCNLDIMKRLELEKKTPEEKKPLARVQLLLSLVNGKDKVAINAKNSISETALHVALHYRFPNVALALIEKGIDVTIKNGSGETAKDIAKRIKGSLDDASKEASSQFQAVIEAIEAKEAIAAAAPLLDGSGE